MSVKEVNTVNTLLQLKQGCTCVHPPLQHVIHTAIVTYNVVLKPGTVLSLHGGIYVLATMLVHVQDLYVHAQLYISGAGE